MHLGCQIERKTDFQHWNCHLIKHRTNRLIRNFSFSIMLVEILLVNYCVFLFSNFFFQGAVASQRTTFHYLMNDLKFEKSFFSYFVLAYQLFGLLSAMKGNVNQFTLFWTPLKSPMTYLYYFNDLRLIKAIWIRLLLVLKNNDPWPVNRSFLFRSKFI